MATSQIGKRIHNAADKLCACFTENVSVIDTFARLVALLMSLDRINWRCWTVGLAYCDTK